MKIETFQNFYQNYSRLTLDYCSTIKVKLEPFGLCRCKGGFIRNFAGEGKSIVTQGLIESDRLDTLFSG